MSFLPKIFRAKRGGTSVAHQHCVTVRFYYGSTNFQHLYALDDLLRSTIADSKVGVYDGYDVADDGSEGAYRMFGPDADQLFRVIHPLLDASCFMNGATVTLWYGLQKRRTPKRVFELPVKT